MIQGNPIYLATLSIAILFAVLWSPNSSARDSDVNPYEACSLVLPPQTMRDEYGQPDGYAVRVLESVASELNWSINIEYFPWARVAHKAQKGECDIVLTVLRREDYASYMVFPEQPILQQKNVIIVAKDSSAHFDGDIESFVRENVISMYRDKAINDEFQRIRQARWANIQLTNTSQSSLQMLLLQRVDAVFENELTAVMELSKLNALNKVKILQPALNVTPAYITFPKGGRLANESDAFDRAIVRFAQSEEFKKIQETYLGRVDL